MMIYNINPYQGLQNAIRPGGSSSATSVEDRQVVSSGRGIPAPMPDADTYDPQLVKITEGITALQRNLDLTLVYYPPFFPIATYQRVDLITEMNGIGQAIEKADVNSQIKELAAPAIHLSEESSDAEIANALDSLIAVRDTLVQERTAAQEDVRPGSILALEA